MAYMPIGNPMNLTASTSGRVPTNQLRTEYEMNKSIILQALGATAGQSGQRSVQPSQESHGDVAMLAYECEQLAHQLSLNSHELESNLMSIESIQETQENLDGLVAALECLADEPSSKGARALRVLLHSQLDGYGLVLPSMEDAEEPAQHQKTTAAGKSMWSRMIEAVKAFLAKVLHHLRMIFDLRYKRQQKAKAQLEKAMDDLRTRIDEIFAEDPTTQTPKGKKSMTFAGWQAAMIRMFGSDPGHVRAAEFADSKGLDQLVAVFKLFLSDLRGQQSFGVTHKDLSPVEAFSQNALGRPWVEEKGQYILKCEKGEGHVTISASASHRTLTCSYKPLVDQHAGGDALTLKLSEQDCERILKVGLQCVADSADFAQAVHHSKFEELLQEWNAGTSNIRFTDKELDDGTAQKMQRLVNDGCNVISAITRLIENQFKQLNTINEFHSHFSMKLLTHAAKNSG